MKLNNTAKGKNITYNIMMLLGAMIISLLIGAIFLLVLEVNPLEAYYYLLFRPFSSIKSIGEITIKLTPILLIGVGTSLTFQSKLINLGGEGQLCLGAIGMTIVGTSQLAQYLGIFWIPVGMILAMIFGGLWGGIAGFFKTYFKASETITTLLLNYIAIQLLSFCVYYPLRDPEGNIPQSAKVAAVLPKLTSYSRTNIGFIIALLAVILYWVIMKKTKFGYNLKVLGGSVKAALYSGIHVKKYYFIIFCISGAFAGLAGSIEVAGTQTRLLEGISGSFGFSGVVAALMGGLHPIGVLVSSILLASLDTGAEVMQVKTGVSSLFVNVLEALIILFILLGYSFFGIGNPLKRKGRN